MSVRVRVSAVATVIVAIVLAGASLLLVARQRTGLVEQLTDSLSADAERIAAELGSGAALTWPDSDDDDRVVLVADGGGRVLAAKGDPDVTADLAPTERADGDATLDGDRYRVVTETYEDASGLDGVVIVAGSRDDVDESVDELIGSLLWVVPIAVVVLFAVVWMVVGRTLSPVERIRAQVAGIGVTELDRRVPVPSGGDEVARLAVTMNEMLARLEQAVRRQRQFVADASHELRTPLTRMRTELEVDERHPEAADPAATRRSQLHEIAALQRLIEDLLTLARSDAGAAPAARDVIDLDDIVLDELRSTAVGTLRFDTTMLSAAQVAGDPAELRRVVRNLLDNAVAHARTTVGVELAEVDGSARLAIGDDGPGIPADRRAEVFERFTRIDEARTGGVHAGLGLAIVRDIVERHGGTVIAGASPMGGAEFVVELPARAVSA